MKRNYPTDENDLKTVKDSFGDTAWRCKYCGKINYGDEPPDECPYCFFPHHPFEKVGKEK